MTVRCPAASRRSHTVLPHPATELRPKPKKASRMGGFLFSAWGNPPGGASRHPPLHKGGAFAAQHTTGPFCGTRPGLHPGSGVRTAILSLLPGMQPAPSVAPGQDCTSGPVSGQPYFLCFSSHNLPGAAAQYDSGGTPQPPLCKGGTAWRSHAGGIVEPGK